MSVTTGVLRTAFGLAILAGTVGTIAAVTHDVVQLHYNFEHGLGEPATAANVVQDWLPIEIPVADTLVCLGLNAAIKRKERNFAKPPQTKTSFTPKN